MSRRKRAHTGSGHVYSAAVVTAIVALSVAVIARPRPDTPPSPTLRAAPTTDPAPIAAPAQRKGTLALWLSVICGVVAFLCFGTSLSLSASATAAGLMVLQGVAAAGAAFYVIYLWRRPDVDSARFRTCTAGIVVWLAAWGLLYGIGIGVPTAARESLSASDPFMTTILFLIVGSTFVAMVGSVWKEWPGPRGAA